MIQLTLEDGSVGLINEQQILAVACPMKSTR
jgi:hypothetical protein